MAEAWYNMLFVLSIITIVIGNLFAIPVAVIVLGLVIVRMVPAFQVMQARIDRINTVLREQITGIRVVRAFVREQQESTRFAVANADLTDMSLRAGRLMSTNRKLVWLGRTRQPRVSSSLVSRVRCWRTFRQPSCE